MYSSHSVSTKWPGMVAAPPAATVAADWAIISWSLEMSVNVSP